MDIKIEEIGRTQYTYVGKQEGELLGKLKYFYSCATTDNGSSFLYLSDTRQEEVHSISLTQEETVDLFDFLKEAIGRE